MKDDDDKNFDDLIGVLKGVNSVEFQNILRDESDDELKLPFEPFPSCGIIVTNELINKIREEEGVWFNICNQHFPKLQNAN